MATSWQIGLMLGLFIFLIFLNSFWDNQLKQNHTCMKPHMFLPLNTFQVKSAWLTAIGLPSSMQLKFISTWALFRLVSFSNFEERTFLWPTKFPKRPDWTKSTFVVKIWFNRTNQISKHAGLPWRRCTRCRQPWYCPSA